MAAINVVLNGTFTTDAGSVPGSFQGTMAYSDRGVGGGPMPPVSIWPDPGHPAHPIAPGGPPPHVEHPIAPGGEKPAHPIELPEPGHPLPEPPTEPPTNPADPSWVWGYNPTHGWLPVHVPGPTDPQPH